MDKTEKIQNRFKINGGLSLRKIREYLPAMIITNLSSLLLVSVDGMVVGNFIGKGALSSVNVFYPAIIFIGALTALISIGIATCLSTSIGKNDHESIQYAKASSKTVMIVSAIAVAIIQIPLVYFFINSYDLSEELRRMTWQYAIGIMISIPFGLISTIGVYELQIFGKMKALAWLSVIEGVVNLILDLLFVGLINMGVAGAGFGTAGANIIRCTITVIYLAKYTDIYKTGGMKPRKSEVKDIFTLGIPDFAYSALAAIQSYFMMKLLLSSFGDDGGTIKGVCTFCFSLTGVIVSGILGAARPMVGLLSGGKDSKGLRILMRQGIICLLVFTTAMVAVIMLFPSLFYTIHGVDEIPAGGLLALRIYSLYFIIEGVDALFRLYFANRKDTKFATSLSIFGNIALPLIAYLISIKFSAPYIWFAYLLKEVIVFILCITRYFKWIRTDNEASDDNSEILYLSVKPSEAVEASRMIRHYADEFGCPLRISYRVSLCMEEMVAYAADSEGNENIETQIVINLTPTEAIFTMLDTGRCIALNEDKDKQFLTTNNYEIIKRLAKSVDYQYILNLNYTVLHFSL